MNNKIMLIVALACATVGTEVMGCPTPGTAYVTPVIHNFNKPCRNPHRFWASNVVPVAAPGYAMVYPASPIIAPAAPAVVTTSAVAPAVVTTPAVTTPVVTSPVVTTPVVTPVAPAVTPGYVIPVPPPPRPLVGVNVLGLRIGVGY